MKENRNELIQNYLSKHRILGKCQREYKKLLSTKLLNRKEAIVEASNLRNISQLRQEKDIIKAQIWVASGATHMQENRVQLNTINCHVACQEMLSDDIKNLKHQILHFNRQVKRMDKDIYTLNRKTIPDNQHQAHVARVRTTLQLLENKLEVNVRRECTFNASNAKLKEEIVKLLNDRTIFNNEYSKVISKLNSDKKYLLDLIDYALMTFENCIAVYEKIDNANKKEARDSELRKIEVQGLTRQISQDNENQAFVVGKAKRRKLADLEAREYKRRDLYRQKSQKKINLYNKVLKKILDYSKTNNVQHVIEKYQEQESLYYSYFNYFNRLSYHMTLLDNSVNRLFSNIIELKKDNSNVLDRQLSTISNLEEILNSKMNKNLELVMEKDRRDVQLYELLHGMEVIFKYTRADSAPLQFLLGDHTQITISNVARFSQIAEKRLNDIVQFVYYTQRKDGKRLKGGYTVWEIQKYNEHPTELQDIVLTQQCPECAEAEAVNEDDRNLAVLSLDEIKVKLREDVNQPEMQYRLHSISQCRLPRSRVLASKRN